LENHPVLKEIADDPSYEVQVIYTQIDADLDSPGFTTYTYRLDPTKYFYPASTVKFPIALLSLQKLNELAIEGLNRNTFMHTDSAYSGQGSARYDSSATNLNPSIGHYIKKIFIASDNDAYNRLYEFLGQDYIHHSLGTRGYTDTRILHRLSIPLSIEQNRASNPIHFIFGTDTVYREPLRIAQIDHYDRDKVLKGKGYLNNDSLISQPFDFTNKNFFPLDEQHRMMIALFYPQKYPFASFDLTEDDRNFVQQWMSTLPSQSGMALYSDSTIYYDSYVKFFMFGDSYKSMPEHIRIYNKIGMAYGYLIDNAYIVDQKNKISFFLSAVIHVNKNQIYNDGIYEYEQVGLPFLAELGRAIYDFELERINK
jgi:hypothetical protein